MTTSHSEAICRVLFLTLSVACPDPRSSLHGVLRVSILREYPLGELRNEIMSVGGHSAESPGS